MRSNKETANQLSRGKIKSDAIYFEYGQKDIIPINHPTWPDADCQHGNPSAPSDYIRRKQRSKTEMDESGKPKRRHLNADQRRALRSAELQTFVRQYGRRAQKNWDPNDRAYDRELEQRITQMKPSDLDRLLREDEDED